MTVSTSNAYGNRLIPQILDDLAVAEPDRIIYSIATSSDISRPLRDVSARAFAQAVDKTAWWLREQVGPATEIRTVGYIGPHDLRHILLTYASVKAGYAALFLSPKNSTEGALAVLKAAKCNIWVRPVEQPTLLLMENVLLQHDMRVLELPQLDDLLDAATTRPFVYDKTFEAAAQDPFCLLHTSGSTGLPKPIVWSHGLIGTMDAVRLLPPSEGDGGLAPWTVDWKDGDRIYSSFPMSHGAGIIMNILMPSLFRLHCILGPARVIPNISLMESLAEHGRIDIWSMVPSLVDELGEIPDVLAKYKSSKFICASGGPVSPISAAKVNEVIRVLNLTGTTEGLFIGNLVVDREDWLYFAFHPFSGFVFKEVEPGIYEHWIQRNEHAPLFQGIFHTFPDQQLINIKDLYVQHPTKPGLWAYKGRNDDVVVLSNGYKISPLETEALITTHPAIDGCLMIGSSKPQAGLLIELKDPSAPRNNELFDTIWAMVERANSVSLHKNQLHRDFIAFAEPHKPFIRTDKGTIKRRATLDLYADYIERFYTSRLDDLDANLNIAIDTTSVQSTVGGVSQILGALSPLFHSISPDDDVFHLGLDSLLVIRVIKCVRIATGLQDQLAPRHLYSNPTVAKFSAAVAKVAAAAQVKETNGAGPHKLNGDHKKQEDDEFATLERLLRKHNSRLLHKVNPFDLMNPNIYIGMNFFFPLRDGISFGEAFSVLQQGLRRTIETIPVLDGKVMACSDQEQGYKKGNIRITLPPLPSTACPDTNPIDPSSQPRQFTYQDLSSVLPPFKTLRDTGFVSADWRDDLFLDAPWFPPLPADVLIARANFVEGGCILATNFHHWCFDGTGVVTILQIWAEHCRYVMGDTAAKCDWLHPESLNYSLPLAIYEQEGYARPAHEVDPNVWGYLGFPDPTELTNGHLSGEKVGIKGATNNGYSSSLPRPPDFPRKFAWPPVGPKDGRFLKTTTFVIPPEKVEQLRHDVTADPTTKGTVMSVNDIVQAFFWRAALRARHRAATERRGESSGPDDMAILELPIDARPYFSTMLPSTYMGSCLVTNRPYLPVDELCSPQTSVGYLAHLIREAAKHINSRLVHDAFTLLQSIPDYTMLTNACMGLEGMHAMLNNMILFEIGQISFGTGLFANGGSPEVMRIQMDRFNTAFRLLLIYPMRQDGAVELQLGTLPEEFEMLTADSEFMKYARFVG